MRALESQCANQDRGSSKGKETITMEKSGKISPFTLNEPEKMICLL
jgi:hypothetical protein